MSPRGLGLILTREVQRGDRLSIVFPLAEGDPDMRVTLEVRHVRAGGLFRMLSPADHERIVRFIA